MSDFKVFFKQFREQFETTGSIAPSSRFLGEALSRFVTAQAQRRRILEVGPGTGAVTRCIIPKLGPNDKLVMVELNDNFVEVLRSKLTSDEVYKSKATQIEIIHDRLQALATDQPFDAIVSGLPLNNFQPTDIEEILGTYQKLLKPGGTLSFFEYMFFRGLRSPLPGRMKEVSAILSPWLRKYEFKRDWVWPNVPPAWAHHVRFA
jgi:phosphatidylethanolamine/phosphatidyl-N-methylethanolamine N-methyltransferase